MKIRTAFILLLLHVAGTSTSEAGSADPSAPDAKTDDCTVMTSNSTAMASNSTVKSRRARCVPGLNLYPHPCCCPACLSQPALQPEVTHEVPVIETTVCAEEEKRLTHIPLVEKRLRNVVGFRTHHVPVLCARVKTVEEPYTEHVPMIERLVRPVVEGQLRHVPVLETKKEPVVLQVHRTEEVHVIPEGGPCCHFPHQQCTPTNIVSVPQHEDHIPSCSHTTDGTVEYQPNRQMGNNDFYNNHNIHETQEFQVNDQHEHDDEYCDHHTHQRRYRRPYISHINHVTHNAIGSYKHQEPCNDHLFNQNNEAHHYREHNNYDSNHQSNEGHPYHERHHQDYFEIPLKKKRHAVHYHHSDKRANHIIQCVECE